MVSVNLLSVIVAALLYVLIGWAWYSPRLFGDIHCCAQGVDPTDQKPCCTRRILGSFLVGIVIAFILSIFMDWLNIVTVMDGAILAFFIWLGFLATTQFESVLWAHRSFKHYCIHAGFFLVAFLVMGGLLGVWT